MSEADKAQAASSNSAARTTAILLGIEREARAAQEPEALGFVIANRTRSLIAYDRAVFVTLAGRGKAKIVALSNIAVVEKNAPMVEWLRKTVRHLYRDTKGLSEVRTFEGTSEVPNSDDGSVSRDWWPAHTLWVPMRAAPGMPPFGGLLLMRSQGAWTDPEKVLSENLADCYAHAWNALSPVRRGERKVLWRVAKWGVAAALVAAMAIPVPRSVVAPARIEPRDPIVIAAPMDGVVEEILVDPNQSVAEGEVLFRYVDAELLANLDVAEQSVAAAEADLRRAQQQAFGDPRSKAEVALKEAELELKRIERDYGRFLASQIAVEAPTAGLTVFADAAEWRGRPVQTGLGVMILADPAQVQIGIDIPVGDAIATDVGATVNVFLDIDPLNPVPAVLERAAYGAAPAEGGVLAYRAVAQLQEGVTPPRIGLHGTARIFGDPLPLGLFLFRKPISAIRQYLGI